jgi:hypothetical protein
MNPLQEQLTTACEELGLKCDLDYTVKLSSGREVRAEALIRGLGANNGMLIVTDHGDVQHVVHELVDEGYGFSVLSVPSPTEEFDLKVYREMFRDWGWSESAGETEHREPDAG